MADDSEEVICPKVELLTEIETNILCSVAGCSKILPNTSSLRMHLVKTHNVITDLKENKMFDRESSEGKKTKKKMLYCCPVEGCVRGRNSGRPFSRLAHVKQHYMTIHGEKKYACKICGKKFGRNDACSRHEKACGKVFPCSCGCPYNNRTSMLNHAKRNGHSIPTVSSSKDSSSPDTTEGNHLCLSILPLVDKKMTVFRPLRPKKLLVNAETQTEEQQVFSNNTTRQLVQTDKSFPVDVALPTTVHDVVCEHTQTIDEAYTQTMNNKYSMTMEKTQTMDEAYTQTMAEVNIQTMDEAYTQTMEEVNIQTMDEAYTQTIGEVTRQTMDEAYTQTSFITDEHFDMDFTIDNEEFKELTHSQTQTNWGFPFDDGFPLFEDNETQTLEPYLQFDSSNITSDCGTQTKNLFDIFSVDTQTQTLLPLINLTEEQFESHCGDPVLNDQTQTLENNIYLNSET